MNWEARRGAKVVDKVGSPITGQEHEQLIANVFGATESQQTYNTLLIAAAPRMVNTLLMVREELVFGGDWETARNKIDEVLAKARGK